MRAQADNDEQVFKRKSARARGAESNCECYDMLAAYTCRRNVSDIIFCIFSVVFQKNNVEEKQ